MKSGFAFAPLQAALIACAVIAGCGTTGPQAPAAAPVAEPAPAPARATIPRYRCDHGIEFSVRFVDDSAIIDSGPRGLDVLLRDAGGMTPQQSVYSSARLRAEFGLGASGQDALLHYLSPALEARCTRS